MKWSGFGCARVVEARKPVRAISAFEKIELSSLGHVSWINMCLPLIVQGKVKPLTFTERRGFYP